MKAEVGMIPSKQKKDRLASIPLKLAEKKGFERLPEMLYCIDSPNMEYLMGAYMLAFVVGPLD